MCSVDDDDSKKNVKRWLSDVRKIIRGENFNAILVMNKIDLMDNDDKVMYHLIFMFHLNKIFFYFLFGLMYF